MSLSALPTELDERLPSFLDCDGLSRIYSVSKYWQALSEPYLYRDIHFKPEGARHARGRLLALISRPHLSGHIKSITFPSTNSFPWDYPGSHEWLRASLHAICNAIDDILRSEVQRQGYDLGMPWLSEIVSDSCMEGSISLIACLARDLESIHIHAGNSFNGHLQKMAMVSTLFPKRFSNLHHVDFATTAFTEVPIISTVESLAIQDVGDLELTSHGFKATALRTLELIKIKAHECPIQILCDNGCTPHLTNVILRGLRFYSITGLAEAIKIFRDHCQALQDLELTEMANAGHHLQGIHELTSLVSLRIDPDLFGGNNNLTTLLQPDKLLPSSLTTPDLIRVNLLEFARDLRDDLNQHDQDAAMSTLTGFMTTTSITDLNLHLMNSVYEMEVLQPLLFQSLQRLTYLLYRSKNPGVQLATCDRNGCEMFGHAQVRAGAEQSSAQE